ILLFPATTWLLFALGRDLFGSRAALYGSLALIATPAFHIGGVSASPDTPLAVFWAVALFSLWRAATEQRPAWLYVFGAAVGGGFLCKYCAVLLVPAAVLFLLRRDQRKWLWSPALWTAAAVALIATTPVLYWNAQHGFASVRYQLVERHHAAGFSWQNTG